MEDLESIMELLPVVERSSTLFWPSQVVEALRSISRGPLHSRVHSGDLLFLAISDIRNSLSLSSETFAPCASDGYALFFDELMSRVESEKWFEQVLPSLANLLLRLPFLLETHYRNADGFLNDGENGFKTGLRLLGSQEAGIVILSQELIGALLACSFLCLFPITNRGAKHLPTINFDILFENLYDSYSEKQEHKIKCIIHYFERISSFTPVGFVSFERKVLHSEDGPSHLSYPKTALWSNSVIPLCHFEVHNSGFIEDQTSEALEVDFANKYLGGGALQRGCVQEEIRFMINPELIAGMLFLPSMADNEAIEIVGVERFSTYKGYASTFRFSGDYVDKKDVDFIGRRKTRIIAIDALSSPGRTQYKFKSLFREVNKAFCGFLDHQSKYYQYEKMFQESEFSGAQLGHDVKDCNNISMINPSFQEAPSTSMETIERRFEENMLRSSRCIQSLLDHNKIGIATGNWGCGAFGGDPEVKSMIQWLAASQALRPFILYYTFNEESSKNLEQVTRWILSHGWTVGDLWNMLTEYSSQRLRGKTKSGFFTWLLPSMSIRSCVGKAQPNCPIHCYEE